MLETSMPTSSSPEGLHEKLSFNIPIVSPRWNNNNGRHARSYLNTTACQENADFHMPEYLYQQKRILQTEIQSLKDEIFPLKGQYRILKKQALVLSGEEEEDTNTYSESNLIELRNGLDRATDQLAMLRRFYADGTLKRLESDIQYQRQKLSDMNDQLSTVVNAIESYGNELDQIVNSEVAESIRNNCDEIETLIKERDQQKNIESDLIQVHIEKTNKGIMFIEATNQIVALKKKISNTEHQKMMLKHEQRKKIQDLDAKISALKLLLLEKKSSKERENKKDEWKRKLRINTQNSGLKVMDEYLRGPHKPVQPRLARPNGSSRVLSARQSIPTHKKILPALDMSIPEEVHVEKPHPEEHNLPLKDSNENDTEQQIFEVHEPRS